MPIAPDDDDESSSFCSGLLPGAAKALRPFPEVTRDEVFRVETRRLWLRWIHAADTRALESFASLREVAGLTGSWPHPLPAGEAERRIAAARAANEAGEALVLGMALRERPGELIGLIGIGGGMTGAAGGPGLGYMLHPAQRGRGLAPEAAQALLDVVFTYTAIAEVTASTHVGNAASRRVLEKCGFRHIGSGLMNLPARGGMVSTDSFVLDARTWAALSNWSHGAARREPRAADAGKPDPTRRSASVSDVTAQAQA
jgi:RimJ/RimL family protein N-acetyltransferase